jgi:hypothetical protein
MTFSPVNNLSPWLDRESLMAEIVASVIEKHKKPPTAIHFAEVITPINELIQYASAVADSLGVVTLHHYPRSLGVPQITAFR